MAKRFVSVCAGLFLLALSYHFGASTATAQAASGTIVALATDGLQNTGRFMAITADGDAYFTADGGVTWGRRTNVFGLTTTQQAIWGDTKAKFR